MQLLGKRCLSAQPLDLTLTLQRFSISQYLMVFLEVHLIRVGVNFKGNSPTPFENEDQIPGSCALVLI